MVMDDKRKSEIVIAHAVRDVPSEETVKYYTEWADKYEYHATTAGYHGHEVLMQGFLKLRVPKDCEILDIGAGTGLVGRVLKANGYRHVDGHDGCQAMLDESQKLDSYRRYICALLSKNGGLPVPDNTYDAIVSAGALLPGHIPDEAFVDMIRVVKPGGVICWSRGRAANYENVIGQVTERDFETTIQRLVERGLWESIDGYPMVVPNYYEGKEGLVHGMKVLK